MDELAGLSESARKVVMERFRLLQPHLENNEPLTSVAQAAGIPYRTAHRLVSEYWSHRQCDVRIVSISISAERRLMLL